MSQPNYADIDAFIKDDISRGGYGYAGEIVVALRAEIAALTADKERLGADYRGCIEERAAARAAVVALTEHNRTLTEQRDRARRDLRDATNMLGEARYWITKSGVAHPSTINDQIAPVEIRCKDTLAALDAEASAEKGV